MQLNGVPPTLDQVKALALTNYGHFTSMLTQDGRVRGLSLHMQRLARDCRLLFDVELDTDRVRHHVRQALTGEAPRTVARVTVYDPVSTSARSVSCRPARRSQVQANRPTRRLRRRVVPEPGRDGRRDRDVEHRVRRDGSVVWPRSEWLSGITMTLLTQALDEPVRTEPLTLADLPDMEFVFATNAAVGIRPVASVDDQSWPIDHPLLKQLRDLYEDIPTEQI